MVELILGNVLVESLVLIKLRLVKDLAAGLAILISVKIVLRLRYLLNIYRKWKNFRMKKILLSRYLF